MVYSYDVIPDLRLLSRWFSAGSTLKSFGVKKHALNAYKYFSKHFFMNWDATLYVIMIFIL